MNTIEELSVTVDQDPLALGAANIEDALHAVEGLWPSEPKVSDPESPETQLLDKIEATGDRAAFGQLWALYYPKLVGFANRRVAHSAAYSRTTGEDVLSDVMLNTLRTFGTLEANAQQGESPVYPRLRTVYFLAAIRRRVIDLGNKSHEVRRTVAVGDSLDVSGVASSVGEASGSEVEYLRGLDQVIGATVIERVLRGSRGVTLDVLRAWLASQLLSPDYREKTSEIAARFGTTEDAIRQAISRARARAKLLRAKGEITLPEDMDRADDA